MGLHHRLLNFHMNVDLREFAEQRRAAIDDTALPRYFGIGRAISVASGHASGPRFASYLPASADEARLNVREMHAIGEPNLDAGHMLRLAMPDLQVLASWISQVQAYSVLRTSSLTRVMDRSRQGTCRPMRTR